MKKYNLLLLLVTVFSLYSCNTEKELTPSPFVLDRVLALLDMTNPTVKDLKQQTGVNLLSNFSDTLDFKFGMYEKGTWRSWAQIEIIHLKKEDANFAVEQFNNMVLSNFKNSEFNKRTFPRKILLTQEIKGDILAPDVILREPDNQEVGAWSAIGGKYTYMFAFDKEVIDILEPHQLESLRNVKLYCFLGWLYNYNNLYSELPKEFYELADGLHRERLSNFAPSDAIENGKYDVHWYISNGMAITKNSPAQTVGVSFEDRLEITADDRLSFPTKERDFRNFLNVIFCETEDNIRTYYLPSELFKKRMRIVLDVLKTYGIDFTQHKPVLNEFYQ